jgi:hypothetical protein
MYVVGMFVREALRLWNQVGDEVTGHVDPVARAADQRRTIKSKMPINMVRQQEKMRSTSCRRVTLELSCVFFLVTWSSAGGERI